MLKEILILFNFLTNVVSSSKINQIHFALACGEPNITTKGKYNLRIDEKLEQFVANLTCDDDHILQPPELNQIICNEETELWEGEVGKCVRGEVFFHGELSNFVTCIGQDYEHLVHKCSNLLTGFIR